MFIIPAILMVIAAALFWWVRAKTPGAGIISDEAEIITDSPPFLRRPGEHPVDGVTDPSLLCLGIATAFLNLDGGAGPNSETALRHLARELWCEDDEEAALDWALVLWLIEESGNTDEAILRISRRLYQIDGNAHWPDLDRLLKAAFPDGMSVAQNGTVFNLLRALHVDGTDPVQ